MSITSRSNANSQYSSDNEQKGHKKEEYRQHKTFVISPAILFFKRTKKYSRAAGDRSQCTNVEAILYY